ncbi:hypothetical protein [Altererythrobacter sp. MF3-039]|uniref:hypothetical protein n=1 Tax=Altererythrobacter sp. MF3-039 TaxID=3252901 RepID=UPI00390C4C19
MRACHFAASILALAPITAANAQDSSDAVDQVIELTKQSMALRSVQGDGNETDKVAALFRGALLEGGWSDSEIEVVPFEDTAYLIAT